MTFRCLNRRDFLGISAGMLAGIGMAPSSAVLAATRGAGEAWDPSRPMIRTGKPLRVQPILMYATPEKQEARSYKSWGSVQTDAAAEEEAGRIASELAAVAAKADFEVEFLPVARVKTPEAAAEARAQEADLAIVYPAGGGGGLLKACFGEKGNTLVFLRHKSGPVYYWYEALSVRYLNTGEEETPKPGNVLVEDVVVDDCEELLWRLRAWYGVRNFLGSKILAVGGPWGKYAPEAPAKCSENFGIEIIDLPYSELEPRIVSALADPACMARASEWTDTLLAQPNVTLETERDFVVNCFMLYSVFKDLLAEYNAPIFTIKECMSTILPMSKTTACLTLSLMNDEGIPTFCESDFVIIPAGILLHYISGRPVFLHNSTFPHGGTVTCAHCTGPRRMNGDRYEPTRILTHYESDYGAAPKVDMPKGQRLTFVDPEYDTGRWLGFQGTVEDNPFYAICRSQQDVHIEGNWKKLTREVRDSHWVMVYGDYLRETSYAAKKAGIRWDDLA